MSDYFLPPGGGYRKLKAYQIAEAICDLTSLFVKNMCLAILALATKWSKQHALANRILQKAAWLLPHRKKRKSN